MKCLQCQADNREGVKFCEECGAAMEIKCPSCGALVPLGKKFCGECGHDLKEPTEAPPIDYSEPQSYTPKFLADKILTTRSSIEGERKLVTVLFADVANYTSIAEKLDPEEVHLIMDGCFKILMDEIHRYEGTINQFTGDGVMALFGAPVAHEDHAQRACYAALAIQRALEKYREGLEKRLGLDFKMRVGLNSGRVVVGSIGDDLRMDYTAVGDTTNLAARMESMARPGAILVADYSYKLARDFFDFRPLGKVRVKGKEKALEAYELLGAREVETRIEAAAAKGLTKFVGRERETEVLKEAFEKAQSGSGQAVGIVGEAGVGKSRLLIELRNMIPKGEYTYLEGRCLHYGGAMPYLPILDILRSYLDIKEGDEALVIKKKMEEKVLHLDERLRSVFPPFQELLSLEVEDSAYLQLEPGQKKVMIFEAIRDLLVRDSQNKPLVLAVEDLHWIDKTSEQFLDYLIGWLPNAHILLILLYRPDYTDQWGDKSYYYRLGVDQLSTENSAELVQAILEGGEVVPELRELILNRAGGNPLFVEELTQSLLENGTIQRRDHQYLLTRKASEIQVPDTIQGIIAARIDRVEESLKRIMQVASVIGREFAFRILQTIMGMKEELKSSLLDLQGLEFISEKRLFPELEYIFKHALTQEVAYNSLLRKRRREIHEKIGSAIEGLYPERLEEYYELLAYHYGHSDNAEKALEYLDLANQKAARSSAMEEAKAHLDQVVKLLDTLPDTEANRKQRISILANQYFVFLLLLKLPEYYELLTRYEPMATRVEDPGLRGAFYAPMGRCEYAFGYLDQAVQTATKAIELCEAAGNAEGAGMAYLVMQWSHIYRGDYEQALALKEQILRMMDRPFNLRWHVWALVSPSWAYFQLGRWDEAVEAGEKALRVAEEFSNDSLISFTGWAITWAYTLKGDLERAVEYGEMAVQKAPTPADRAWAQVFLASAWCRAGEPRRGVEVLAKIAHVLRAARFMIGLVPTALYLGEGHLLAGEYDKATQSLEECLKLAERCGMRYYIGGAHRLLGEVALKANLSLAAPHFEKSIGVCQEIKAENELALAYSGYGRLHKQQGRIAQAREYLTKALETFERLGTLIEPDKVRKELADLPKG
jgi:class 3 adenylate cyclase/tetratricopeptide (TPR) repeat protein